MGELWELLAEENEAEDGIPKSLVDKKMAEMKKEGNDEHKINKEEAKNDWSRRFISFFSPIITTEDMTSCLVDVFPALLKRRVFVMIAW